MNPAPITANRGRVASTSRSARQSSTDRSADTFSSILSKYGGNPDATGAVTLAEHLPDLPAVRRRLQELAMSARESVLAFSPTAASPAASRIASRPLDLGALRRGVRMRTICLDGIVVEPDAMAYALPYEGTHIVVFYDRVQQKVQPA